MEFTRLSLADVATQLDDIARDAHTAFGTLSSRQLNWRADATRWSVGQCFAHLLAANRLMFQAGEEALTQSVRRTVWQRLPVLPRVFGRLLIRSQAPSGARKFTAPAKARPAESDIAADVIQRFVEQHRTAIGRLQTMDEEEAARTIMTSPFIRVVTYSVLDGWRIVVAHDRRHVEQARRVTRSAGFPSS